jgi:hypothetical protein
LSFDNGKHLLRFGDDSWIFSSGDKVKLLLEDIRGLLGTFLSDELTSIFLSMSGSSRSSRSIWSLILTANSSSELLTLEPLTDPSSSTHSWSFERFFVLLPYLIFVHFFFLGQLSIEFGVLIINFLVGDGVFSVCW